MGSRFLFQPVQAHCQQAKKKDPACKPEPVFSYEEPVALVGLWALALWFDGVCKAGRGFSAR